MVLVHYAITLEVENDGLANDTLDFITLQNNLVEKNYPAAAEQPTIVYTITDFRNYITEALHKDNGNVDNGTVLRALAPCCSHADSGFVSLAENLLPPAKPTDRPADTYDNMVSHVCLVNGFRLRLSDDLFRQDNVLAAEKPPDAPAHEVDDGTLKKDNFLFEPSDPWNEASENDVFVLNESMLPPMVTDLPEHSGTPSGRSTSCGVFWC